MATLLAVATPAPADVPIVIDGSMSEWAVYPLAHQDPQGDAAPADVDFGRLWIADDARFVYLRFELGAEVDLSEANGLRLYLDTDADPATGAALEGLGAELEWRFGQRFGTFFGPGGQSLVQHPDLRFRGAPTVSATSFEISIGRDTLPNRTDPLWLGPTFRLVLTDTFGSDRLPDAGSSAVAYTLDQGDPPAAAGLSLVREQASDLRLLTYNVLFDSPWDPALEPGFAAQMAALQPDILCFQEIFSHSLAQTLQLVETWLPSGPGAVWQGAAHSDTFTISRFAVLEHWTLDGNLAVLLDTATALGGPLLIVNVHLPCCAFDSARVVEIDRILAFLRDAREPGGDVDVPPDTPVIITGDANLVGQSGQLDSLLTGDVIDEATFGPDFEPDWDGTALTNLVSRLTEKNMAYTWRNDGSSFWPGHLDYVIFSDAVLQAGRHFVLYTPEMSPATLALFGLEPGDSTVSDHLPVCADFRAGSGGAVPAVGNVALAALAVLMATAATVLLRARRRS